MAIDNESHRILTRITFSVFLVLLFGLIVVNALPSLTGSMALATDEVGEEIIQLKLNIDQVRDSDFRIPAKLSIFALFASAMGILGMHFERKEHGLR